MRRINRRSVATEVPENPLNDCRRLDARDDTQTAAAVPASLDVDGEHPLEALRPGEDPLPAGCRCRGVLAAGGGACLRHDSGPIRARRREHAVIPRQVGDHAPPFSFRTTLIFLKAIKVAPGTISLENPGIVGQPPRRRNFEYIQRYFCDCNDAGSKLEGLIFSSSPG